VGGGLEPDDDGSRLSDYPLKWIAEEASGKGLKIADHLGESFALNARSKINESYEGKWLLAGQHKRSVTSYLRIHESVKLRYTADPGYRPKKLVSRLGSPPNWGELVPIDPE
jgi:hypothetical protein